MREFIVLGVPQTFPCLMAALSSLPAAQEQQMDWIRVRKAGHTCDFAVPELEKLVTRAARNPGEIQPPKIIMGGVQQHAAWGNEIEATPTLWPGVNLASASDAFVPVEQGAL